MAANVETMFSVREKPWHGLGNVVQDAPDSQQALCLAGLDWRVNRVPVQLESGDMIPGFYGNVRDSDKKILGIVSERYQILQNSEAFAFTDALAGAGEIRYETAGSLKNGRKVWMLARLAQEYTILKDTFEPYLCFVNSHDGSGAVRVLMTPIRVVCQNTLNIALRQAQRSWSTSHIGDISARFTEAQTTLGLAKNYMSTLGEEADLLTQVPINANLYKQIIEELLPIKEETGARAKQTILAQRATLDQAYAAPDLTAFAGTAWGFLNAVSDFTTHTQSKRTPNRLYKENRFAKIIVGEQMFDKAYNIIKYVRAA